MADNLDKDLLGTKVFLREGGENWWEYKIFIESFLQSKGLSHLILEEPASPPPHPGPYPASTAPEPERSAWTAANLLYTSHSRGSGFVKYMVMNTLNATDRTLFIDADNVYTGWKSLETRYSVSNPLVIQAKINDMRSLKCPSVAALPAHIARLRTIKNEIGLSGVKKIDDDDFVGAILHTLPPEMFGWRESFISGATGANNRVSSEVLVSALESYASRQPATTTSSFYSSPPSQSQSRSRRRGGRGDQHCTNCQMNNHTIDRCWAPGGGNEGGGPNRSNSTPAPPTSSTNAPSPSAQPHTSSSATSHKNPGASLFVSPSSAVSHLAHSSVEDWYGSATEVDEFAW